MPNQSLVDLTARTATADTDLIHVNSGGTDYKQTKENFLRGNLALEFSYSSLLTAQVDALPVDATYFGHLWNYGHTTETGMPINGLAYVHVKKSPNAQYSVIEAWSAYSPEGEHYICGKSSGTWGSWTKVPTRSEITALNNSLANSLPTSAIVAITPTGCSNYSNYGNSYYYKRGNQVFVHIGVQGLTASSQTDIFKLPSGYRPHTNFCAVGQGGESFLATSFMSIFSDGTIRITSSDRYAIVDGCFTVFG